MPKISDLPGATVVNAGDFVVVVDNSLIPTTKKVLASALADLAPVQTVVGRTGEVTIGTADVTGLTTLLNKVVYSDTALAAGSIQVTNAVALTQAQYDAIAVPHATTLYIIRDV